MGYRRRRKKNVQPSTFSPAKEKVILVVGTIYVAMASLTALLFSLFFIGIAFDALLKFWDRFPEFSASLSGACVMGCLVLCVGIVLYLIREKWRFIYAGLELGAALGLAMEACLRIGPTSVKGALGSALLGAVYIVVRAFDNFSKAWEERQALKKQKTFVDLTSAETSH